MPAGRTEFPSVIRLYSNLKRLCRKGTHAHLATGSYAVPLVSLLNSKIICFYSFCHNIVASASWSMPLPISPYIASSPHLLLKVYHQKHQISRGHQDSRSKSFALQWKAHRRHLTWLAVSSHCLVPWTLKVPRSFSAPTQAGSWIRRGQYHSGKIDEPPDREHSRPIQETNLLHPVYLVHESTHFQSTHHTISYIERVCILWCDLQINLVTLTIKDCQLKAPTGQTLASLAAVI